MQYAFLPRFRIVSIVPHISTWLIFVFTIHIEFAICKVSSVTWHLELHAFFFNPIVSNDNSLSPYHRLDSLSNAMWRMREKRCQQLWAHHCRKRRGHRFHHYCTGLCRYLHFGKLVAHANFFIQIFSSQAHCIDNNKLLTVIYDCLCGIFMQE